MSCGMKTVKVFLIIFNLIFALVGIGMITSGIVLITLFKAFVTLLGTSFNLAPIVIIVGGVVMFVVAFFGCCGAFKESRGMILTFAGLMAALLVLEIGAGIATFVMKEKVKGWISEGITGVMKNYDRESKHIKVKAIIDAVQNKFNCCGQEGPKDWVALKNRTKFPESCCVKTKCNRDFIAKDVTLIKQEGCTSSFTKWAKARIAWLAGGAVVVCLIEIIGIMFAGCLATAIQNNYEPV